MILNEYKIYKEQNVAIRQGTKKTIKLNKTIILSLFIKNPLKFIAKSK